MSLKETTRPPLHQGHRHTCSVSFIDESPAKVNTPNEPDVFYYYPTPAPETVVIHSIPKKSKDACCWGCAAALCLCFGLKECCR